MGGFSLMHWLVFGVIAILVLGGGRFSNMMGDVAKGIKQFKKGMAEEDEVKPTTRIEVQPPVTRVEARPSDVTYDRDVEVKRDER